MSKSYLMFSYLQGFWRAQFMNDQFITEKIQGFFSPNQFFSTHTDTEFYLGTSQKRCLLLSVDSAKIVQKELELYLSKVLEQEPIPQNTIFEDIEPVYIDSPATFQKIRKDLEKYNKEMRKKEKMLMMKQSLEKARYMYRQKKYFFFAFDVESYERDHACILEVGWSMYNARSNMFMNRHFCVSDFKYLKNGTFVPDMKDRFIFGKTVWATLKEVSAEILADLKREEKDLILIGHDIKMDVKYLESMGINMQEDVQPLAQFDTAELNAARVEKQHERLKLGSLLDEFKIENYCLHNAGNDAYYTLLLFIELCKLPDQVENGKPSTAV